jgi:hypothetical protein
MSGAERSGLLLAAAIQYMTWRRREGGRKEEGGRGEREEVEGGRGRGVGVFSVSA